MDYLIFSSAYNVLLSYIPNTMGFNIGPLEQANCLNVKFWYLANWTKFCSNRNIGIIGNMEAEGANSQPTITGVMQYIEDQHGYTVNRVSVNMMQSLAQNIWFKLGISSVISTM